MHMINFMINRYIWTINKIMDASYQVFCHKEVKFTLACKCNKQSK